MLLHYLALGIIDGPPGGGDGGSGPYTDTGAVDLPNDRMVVLAVPQGSVSLASGLPMGSRAWQREFDPGDHVPYGIDFTAHLDAGEKIAEISYVAMNATAALLGVGVDTAAGFGPLIDTAGKIVQLWFVVDEASWSASSFDVAGVQLPVTVRVETDAASPKRIERSAVLVVRQL